VISAGLFGSDFSPLAQASSLCGACKDACPVDIDLPKLLTRVRAGQTEIKAEQHEGAGLSRFGNLFMRMYSQVARRPRWFTLSQRLAGLGTRLASPFSEYIKMPALTGWGYSKDLPRFAGRTFRERFEEKQARSEVHTSTQVRENAHGENDLASTRGKDELAAQFIEELTKVSGSVIRTNRLKVTQQIIDLLRARQVDRIQLEPGLLDESILQQADISISHTPDPTIRVGVTKAICGLADTGSILVAAGEADHLQASLLPEIHIAVLCDSDLRPSLSDALRLPIVRTSKSAVFITGPSRTGDIEFSLTIGVHGPGEVHVFLVDGVASSLVDD
jgi:L-lactate utilization protein LutC